MVSILIFVDIEAAQQLLSVINILLFFDLKPQFVSFSFGF